MTIEEITDLIERDFPKFEWLIRANSTPAGRYLSNASERGVVQGLRHKDSPLPPFMAYADDPVSALCKTYNALCLEFNK